MSEYRVFWSEEDQEWVATATHNKFLSYLSDDPVDALRGLTKIIKEIDREKESDTL